jgi:hypothetical protein
MNIIDERVSGGTESDPAFPILKINPYRETYLGSGGSHVYGDVHVVMEECAADVQGPDRPTVPKTVTTASGQCDVSIIPWMTVISWSIPIEAARI